MDIRRLNLEELLGVVSIYPWYAGARKELCSRMAEAGTLSEGQLSQAALYVWSRRILSQLVRSRRPAAASDEEVTRMLREMMKPAAGVAAGETKAGGSAAEAGASVAEGSAAGGSAAGTENSPAEAARRIFVVGGDYFTSSQYKAVRHDDDNIFSGFAVSEREFAPEVQDDAIDLCTETLAQIYAEQGYMDEAKQIYSKLSLRYPEKSVYFAALIEKLDKN